MLHDADIRQLLQNVMVIDPRNSFNKKIPKDQLRNNKLPQLQIFPLFMHDNYGRSSSALG